jgi:hypothetical protein
MLEAQHCLLVENLYSVDPVFEPSRLLTEPYLISQADLSDLGHVLIFFELLD